MTDGKQEIKRALGAHGLWRTRLCIAVDRNSADITPAEACRDDRCDFGRWLHGAALPAALRASPHYGKCRTLHAAFHQEAGKVLELALAGRRAEAIAALDPKGGFTRASERLTDAMVGWMREA